MAWMETKSMIIYLSSCLCIIFISLLSKFFNRVWWTPIRIQSAFQSQGIKGPSYGFLLGNRREIIKMKKQAISSPMELSHQLLPRIQPHVDMWIKRYGKNYLSWKGYTAQLIVTELHVVKDVMNNKDEKYSKPDLGSYGRKLFGDGLLAANGEKWFRQRKLANHAFHVENLKGMIPAMIASVEMMLERWRQHKGKEIEVFKEFKVLTSEVISRTAFGSSYLEGQHIFDMLSRLILISSRNSYTSVIPGIEKFVKTKDEIESGRLEQGIRDSILKMVRKREEEAKRSELESCGSDFLGVLVKAYHDMDKTKHISIEDVTDECKTFYIGGHETTTSLLTWTVLLLAIHPDWQDKARKEVLDLFGHRNPTSDGIARMKTMNMVVNESLRLYPPAVGMIREVQKGAKLGKLLVPEKLMISIPILALHHNTEIWGEDAHLFKPERFADGVAKATKNNIAAFLPFGMGPRSCVGMNFAITEAKIALSMILQHYRITLSPTYVHSPIALLAICPQNGLQVILQAL